MSVVKQMKRLEELTSENRGTIEKLDQEEQDLIQERKELKEAYRIAQYHGDEDDALISLEASASKVEERIKALDSKAEAQLYPLPSELQGRRASFSEVYFPRYSQLSEKHQELKSTVSDLKDAIAEEQSKSLDNILEANPEILSVPRLRHLDTLRHSDTMTTKHYAKPPESYNTGPEIPVGLSKRFTQDKIHEGKILKQLDRELANEERKKNEIKNKRGDHDRSI